MDYYNGKEFEISSYFKTIWDNIASIGWYIIGIMICIWYASPSIQERYASWKLRKEEEEYAAKYHKNTDLLQERISSMEASRQKMQQEYYKKCMLVQQEGTERRKTTRGTLGLSLDSNVLGQRLEKKNNDLPPSTGKKNNSLREEYNPLMGDSSRSYRPPKRSCCGKGSCG
ncbi:PREDICTED: uncharacterized protein LOC108553904 isoform X2 [Eufriesea mexicana]|uniref:uncharacterized protein LOC108553904 isoform X2 n=1 Tax=Eufriesea mexicana TaxID=516756 RepID=UPI00083C086D|nr:PREDICTED: uncharacterized protein LOC108553904 isoform X2 [Eufriesea mexicana]